MLQVVDAAWMDRAVCHGDYDLFFSEDVTVEDRESPDERTAREEIAKAICATCPVQQQCLAWALATGQDGGVWGGRSELEREGIRRARRIA